MYLKKLLLFITTFFFLLYSVNVLACVKPPDQLKISESSFEKNEITITKLDKEEFRGTFEITVDGTPIYYSHKKRCWVFNKQCVSNIKTSDGRLGDLIISDKEKDTGIIRVDKNKNLTIYSLKPDGQIDPYKPKLVFQKPVLMSAMSEPYGIASEVLRRDASITVLAKNNGNVIGEYNASYTAKSDKAIDLGIVSKSPIFSEGKVIPLKGKSVIANFKCNKENKVSELKTAESKPKFFINGEGSN